MAEYELIREIFNRCSGNQMRDVEIREVVTDDPLAYVKLELSASAELSVEESHPRKGVTVIDAVADGLRERFTFTI